MPYQDTEMGESSRNQTIFITKNDRKFRLQNKKPLQEKREKEIQRDIFQKMIYQEFQLQLMVYG